MIIVWIVSAILALLIGIMIWCKISIEMDKKKGIQFKSKDLLYLDGYEDLSGTDDVTITVYFHTFSLEFKNKGKVEKIKLRRIKDVKIYQQEELLSEVKYHKIKTTHNFNDKNIVSKKYIVIKVMEEQGDRTLIFASGFPELIKGTLEKAKESEINNDTQAVVSK
ncbi:hypothetical protein [Clostridium ihumii]|uniref:hypothetical protein n=1 Tax=Clostridium ihumii TaxID=1470356 RepID=UPI0005505E68|nr:hypothetical protein [Clostridium ihumii]